ncbi:MAG: fibronectin type III domain-containing protein [Bacteroidales bacterium]|jgi:hypothetical protein|nr:fibronectin type III domain-containing protein [Bacteroidales bacterium]
MNFRFLSIVAVMIVCMAACKKEESQPAQVITLSAGASDTEAICWGKAVKGSSEITEYGIRWDGEFIPATETKADSFGVKLTGLYPGRSYDYMAYAVDGGTNRYGESRSFTTITTPSVYVYPDAKSAIIGFEGIAQLKEWGFYYTNSGAATASSAKVEANGSASVTLDGLQPNVEYSLLPYFITKSNMNIDVQATTFTTKIDTPTVVLNEISNITVSGATFSFEVTSTGGTEISKCGVRYSVNGQTWTERTATYAEGAVTCAVTGLLPATRYYVQAFACNQPTTYNTLQGFSATEEMTTLGAVPTVATPQVTATVSYKANMTGGRVTNDHGVAVTEYGYCWSTTSGGAVAEGDNYKKFAGTGSDAFEYLSYDLLADTKYYVRAYAKNQVGVGYSEQVEVTTPGGSVWRSRGQMEQQRQIQNGSDRRTDMDGRKPD